ncbi:hypothetical protein FHN55_07305 [Streptomyces sp. NP160]|uniref:VanW family protein n=1 Tax=Streptomyces sp. NP160 TaxID=2586637 RepID=UPI0011195C33|nr:VanW family protein [Streptomyces sp. NP160]TNM68585.1 hypothetical protein FHN55_07305 [Streptomyces sp. NP160]
MGRAGGAAQLLEMLERGATASPGADPAGRVPAPRRPQHRLDEAASTTTTTVVLPETDEAPVAGPPASWAPSAHPGPAAPAGPSEAAAARRQRVRVLALVAAGGLVAAAWSGASFRLADRVPEGTTVAGVAIGGLDRDDAVQLLARTLQPRLAAPLPVRLDAPSREGRTTTVDPGVAGLRLDAAATVSRAIGPAGLPTTLWHQLQGRGAVAPVLEGSDADLAAALDRAAVALDVPAVEGSISFASGEPVAVAPVPGTVLDRTAAAALVRRAWLAAPGAPAGERPLPLPASTEEPQATADAVDAALQTQARPAVSAPLTVVVGDRSVVLAPAQVLPALSVVQDGPALRLHVDGAALADAVAAADPATRTPAQDARVDTSGSAPVVVAAVAGSEPDPESLAHTAEAALVATGDARTARASSREVAPGLTTEALTSMGISALLGQVVSPLTADPARTQDVTAAARALDGAVLAPGEPLDVGARMGVPSAEAGWVPATVVVDGRATSTLSAGTTQVASAVHAAAFAAGLQVDARTAPESWNPRDPVGLDAVVGTGTPLVLTEAASTGALLRVEVSDGALRVQVWGSPDRQVSLATSPAADPRPAPQLSDPSPQCVAQPGQDGFTTTVTRTAAPRGGGGQPVTDEVTTTYAPRPAVTCTAPGGGASTGVPLALD